MDTPNRTERQAGDEKEQKKNFATQAPPPQKARSSMGNDNALW